MHLPAMELMVTKLKPPFLRHHSEPLPKIVFSNADKENEKPRQRDDADDAIDDLSDLNEEFDDDFESELDGIGKNGRFSLPDVHDALPEVTYGLKPRTAWMYRLMERAGIGARSARSLPWYENEKEAFQHHAEYLKRLSKLREELIQQEQSNLANALDRLKMRSYGREYVYSQPSKEKKSRQLRHSAQSETPSTKRNNLLTTFEKFQRMRPKKAPPTIMPLEGKSLIDTPIFERSDRQNGHHSNHSNHTDTRRSVEENVRLNLQRLTTHSIPSIPRQNRNNQRDFILESSPVRRRTGSDANNSSVAEERITNMQKQKQKLMKIRHDAREAEKQKLMPQSFRLDTLSDEDKMNLEKLKDYYCIYYVPQPAPATSPTEDVDGLHVRLPSIGTSLSCNHSDAGISARTSRVNGHSSRQVGFKVATDNPIPPTVCNCKCKMFVSGNRLETSMDDINYSIDKTSAVNNPSISRIPISRETSKATIENGWHTAKTNDKPTTPPSSQEKKRIRVDMPAIVYNNMNTPEPVPSELTPGLAKAFKQKELRQKELSNLMEDVKELNKLTENLTKSAS
ncbi:hypothetical protein ACF0H5_023943 [Mactra antiquata]